MSLSPLKDPLQLSLWWRGFEATLCCYVPEWCTYLQKRNCATKNGVSKHWCSRLTSTMLTVTRTRNVRKCVDKAQHWTRHLHPSKLLARHRLLSFSKWRAIVPVAKEAAKSLEKSAVLLLHSTSSQQRGIWNLSVKSFIHIQTNQLHTGRSYIDTIVYVDERVYHTRRCHTQCNSNQSSTLTSLLLSYS